MITLTATITPTVMTIDAVLTLTQWLSPAYPVGAFAYSHGLEDCVARGTVHDADSFRTWLIDILDYGAGHNDVILLSAAYFAEDTETLTEIADFARALAPSSERLLETEQQGSAFSRTAGAVHGLDLPALPYPVAVGRAAALKKLPLRDTAAMFLQAFASNLTSAATRLVPLGQTEAQAVLTDLTPFCRTIADKALQEPLEAISSCTFAADIASMTHETQYSRLFRS